MKRSTPLVTPAQRTAIAGGVNALVEVADGLYRNGLRRVAKGANAAARAGLKPKGK